MIETVLQMNKLLVEDRRRRRRRRRGVDATAAAACESAAARAARGGRNRRRRGGRGRLSKPKRRSRSPRPRDEARPLPWVPSSDGGVSFNLAAACQYALRGRSAALPWRSEVLLRGDAPAKSRTKRTLD